ncbi:substrate-binding domain-containing protein [Agromyces seonyuensis]|uniref:LacI family DNA-binding transcriptional regulator n=1 Tax=Agromyces seonyuensis TaxID=2662446 RepID=A0A6I4NXC4_9MICO|nr:LacI family DNA-binding transcriptional regulator [Agromyces seonyuensis]
MPPRPTLHDVARSAGVSKSLVSLALRGDAGVGAATRERIVQAAAELGYRSNALARSLKQGRTRLVGALPSSLENPYHTDVVEGLEGAGVDAGLSVIMVPGAREPERRHRHLDLLLGLNVDGLVVIGSRVEPERLLAVARRVPVVLVGRPEIDLPGIDVVRNDDEHGAALAVEHLLDAGRRRILHVTSGTGPAGRARRAGYEAAMAARGRAADIRVVVSDAGRALRDAIVAACADGYDAVFARNDLEALAVIDAAADAGIAVPGDLAVVGYDDTALAARTRPHLTSVDQPRAQMGRRALALLLERLDGREDDVRDVFTPTLAVRESSAPPATRGRPGDRTRPPPSHMG